MSDDESDKQLASYNSAVESYEHLESLFHQKCLDFTRIKQELKNCSDKIENIILGEDANCTFFVDLYQLRNQILELSKYVERRSQNMKPLNARKPYDLVVAGGKKKPDSDNMLSFVKGTIETPRINGLAEIAGLWEIKKTLKSLVVLPRTQPQLFLNRKASNSVLLFGPPGTGKTRLVHALAHEAGALLHSVSVSNILSHFVGQSEKNLQFLFEYIRNNNAFSILFIDEVDGFCRKRIDSEQEHSRRIKTELMCQMSRIEENSNMFLICATNCPWDLDTAFLRRFQKRIYIPLPDKSERYDLFKLFTKDIALELSSVQWEHIVEKTEGFSGSDISDLVQQALNIPILELQDSIIWKMYADNSYEPVTDTDNFNLENIVCRELGDLPPGSVRVRTVRPSDILNSLQNVKLTVSMDDIRKYEAFNSKQ
nr:vacuolar protein sorting-associated protein 4B-like [Leptinotarsa decemlineata]